MSQPRIPIARIKSDVARRGMMLLVFPALILWHFNWRLFVLPFAVLWNALEAAAKAAAESVAYDMNARSLSLLVAAWRKIWAAPLGD